MSFFDSKVSTLYIKQYALKGFLTNVQVNPSATLLERTVLGDSGMRHQRGIEAGSLAIEGWHDDTATLGLDAALAVLRADTDGEVATFWPYGETRENLGYSAGAALLEGYEITSQVGNLVAVKANLMANGIFDRSKSLNALKTVTATTSETSIDDNIVTNGLFASDTGWTKGSNWRIASGVADQSTPTASDLSQVPTFALVEGQSYEVVYTVLNRSTGAIVVKVGGTSGTSRTTNATFTETIVAGSGAEITFTADGTWDGDIDVVSMILAGTDGGIFIVHVTAFSASGGNTQWKLHLEESSDDAVGDAFAAKSTITITAVSASRVTFSGAFERYVRLRAERDATSGSLTYQTSYVRS